MFRILISTLVVFQLLCSSAFAGYNNGSAQVPTVYKRYSGSEWVAGIKKHYNGATWNEIEAVGGECDDFLTCYNAETGESTSGWTGSNNYSFSYDIASLRGAKAIRLNMTGPITDVQNDFTASEDIWVHTLFRATSIVVAVHPIVEVFSGGTQVASARYAGSSSSFSVYFGAANTMNLAYVLSPNTTYHIWLNVSPREKYTKLYVGTGTTRPTLLGEVSGTSAATTVDKIKFPGIGYISGLYRYYDQVLVKATDFTTVPE